MDSRPIGFMDSGMGGISVLAEAMRALPEENYIYFGDTAHAPYGDKPPEVVLRHVHQAADRLIAEGCKAIVLACNTATSVAAGELRQELHLPIIGMEPALKPASMLPGTGKVLVLATQNTLKLPKFARLMELYGQDAIPVPCPGLMECVEAGELHGARVDTLLHTLLAPYLGEPVKAAVLGCTHYPFLREAIAAQLPAGTPLVDGNAGTVRQLHRRLEQEGLLNPDGEGSVRFQTSGDAEVIAHMRAMLELA